MIKKIESGRGWFEKVCKLINQNKPVDVYRNLHNDCWSVRQNARVVCHVDYITLRDCKYIVQPAGRRRVLIERRKNVHAFVRGYVCSPRDSDWTPPFSWDYVKYNPYKAGSFYFDHEPDHYIHESKYADLDVTDDDGVLAWGWKDGNL